MNVAYTVNFVSLHIYILFILSRSNEHLFYLERFHEDDTNYQQ